MNTLAIRKLKAFSTQIRQVADRDLNLLRIIEQTLDSLDVQCGALVQLNQAADQFINQLHESNLSFVGVEADLVVLFEDARDSFAKTYEGWAAQHLCAVNAPELHEEDGVVEGYANLLSEAADLHDKLNSLAWIIREQEAEQDKPVPGVFSNADDLFASMGV